MSENIAASAESHVVQQLGLKFETYFSLGRAIQILYIAATLGIGIYCLSQPHTVDTIAIGMSGLILFVRALVGSPVARRLTPESQALLVAYFQGSDTPNDDSLSHD